MTYPTHVLIDGVEYPINTDYRVALSCFDIINDDQIDDIERMIGVITLLFGEEPPICEESREKAEVFLTCGNDNQSNTGVKIDMDFKQDENLIWGSIRHYFGTDIRKTEHLHWYEFINLIENLGNDTSLNNIRELRNYDLSDIKDAKIKRKIIEAKKRVAIKTKLKKTKEQQKKIDKFNEHFR